PRGDAALSRGGQAGEPDDRGPAPLLAPRQPVPQPLVHPEESDLGDELEAADGEREREPPGEDVHQRRGDDGPEDPPGDRLEDRAGMAFTQHRVPRRWTGTRPGG